MVSVNHTYLFNSLYTCVTMVNFLAITVNFSKSNYNIRENDGWVQPMLVLSNPASTNITIRVDTIDREAIGAALTYSVYHDSAVIN